MIQTTVKLLDRYNIRFENQCRIFVDGANPSFIRALKEKVDEDTNYEHQIAYYKKSYPSIYDLQFLQTKHVHYPSTIQSGAQENASTCQRNA